LKSAARLRLRLWIGIAATASFILGFAGAAALQPPRETGILPTQPPTPYIHYPAKAEPGAKPAQRVLVVHGLNANKEFMQLFSSALHDAGFDVYAIDLPGHGDSSARFNGVLAGKVVEQAVSILKPDIAAGHSMGAALLIDLAHRNRIGKLVLMSPGPTEVNDLEFNSALVTSERFDIPAVNAFVPQLEGADRKKFTWGMHSSAPFEPAQIREIVMWLGSDPNLLRTGQRIACLGLMFGGAVAMGVVLLPRRSSAAPYGPAFSKVDVVLCYVLAGVVSMIVQRFVVVLRWMRVFGMDYMVSFFLVAGLVLIVILARKQKGPLVDAGAIAKSMAAAAYVIVFPGLVAGSHLIHMTLPDGRWWRFVVIAAASFPLFLFDESVTRAVGNRWQNAGIGIVTRLLITACITTGVQLFNRESAFIVLLMALFPFFWIALWFATGLVSRHVQNPIAAALFAALVQGWMFAAWFIIA
jgi:pimeloyl-ACP methyl ester carboxylesterase